MEFPAVAEILTRWPVEEVIRKEIDRKNICHITWSYENVILARVDVDMEARKAMLIWPKVG